jgi:hypothetical protein
MMVSIYVGVIGIVCAFCLAIVGVDGVVGLFGTVILLIFRYVYFKTQFKNILISKLIFSQIFSVPLLG